MHWESQPKRSKLPSSENCPAAGYSATAWPASVFDRMLGCPTLSVRSDFLRVAFKPFGSSRRLEIAFDFGVAPALGRQKSSRLGRDCPRLVERSPTPLLPFSVCLCHRYSYPRCTLDRVYVFFRSSPCAKVLFHCTLGHCQQSAATSRSKTATNSRRVCVVSDCTSLTNASACS